VIATILVTGFGPFPGAPINPTGPLVKSLAHPATWRGVRIVPHIFATSYAAVDRELPALLRRHKPDALLMFGLAAKTPHLRIETLARNTLSALPDAAGIVAAARSIAPGRERARPLPTPSRALSAAARRARVKAAVSKDAGDYLCNYLCWRTSQALRKPGSPRIAAFIHVPEGQAPGDLLRAGRAFLTTIAAACR
jgi:pyroglutamyl-peptidase